MTKDDPGREIGTTPIVQSLRGSFKTLKDLDYPNDLASELSNKYLKKNGQNTD